MTKRDNILQELIELNSQLATREPMNIYSVPAGYFDELLTAVMKRIKALEATNTADELANLSPLLSNVSKQNPYSVPAGYFENLAGQIAGIVNTDEHLTADDETAAISPLLAGLKKETPYQVPAGYFENLAAGITAKENKPEAKVVSLTGRKWFRYAAAAVVTGVVVMAGFLFLSGRNKISAANEPYAWVKKNLKKADPKSIDAFVTLADEELPDKADVAVNPVNPNEIKDLMKDVSDQEIQAFLNETAVDDASNINEISIN